jgi:hypothetical protein
MNRFIAVVVLAVAFTATQRVQGGQGSATGPRAGYDVALDTYVRDGLVYYRALRQDRAKLDAFVNSLGATSVESQPKNDQIAFWLNAYNAFVLRTVIDQYPIPLRSPQYPPHSIRQIPGAFERIPRHAGGKTVTLDQIEQTILPGFNDPRLFLALGRGALGAR